MSLSSSVSQIVVSLVNGRPGALNFSYSPVLREFTKATNIRLRFLRTNTLLGHLMGKALRDPTVTRRVRQHGTCYVVDRDFCRTVVLMIGHMYPAQTYSTVIVLLFIWICLLMIFLQILI